VTSRITEIGPEGAGAQSARKLLSASAVRQSARRMLTLGVEGALDDWSVDLDRMPATVDFIAQVVRNRYPSLNPPLHARWRHFVFAGRDLWREISQAHTWKDQAAYARSAFDLVITSVLLDAGAGEGWRFHDKVTGLAAHRSEGLALASLRWFGNGGLSAKPSDPLRVDASALQSLDAQAIAAAFQAADTNPLLGLEGRAALLNRLGAVVQSRTDWFAREDSPRPGGLFDVMVAEAPHGVLPAPRILEVLLDALGPIWQNRPTLDGVPLGDCWPHPALRGDAPIDRYAPLHKLSQWLTYSLIEPLQDAGIRITDIDGLTGLAEYRNGGLFVDMGVLVPRDAASWTKLHVVSDPFVVAWRAMTVALLDQAAPLVRERLGVTSATFPLGCVLEGGTWAAGRVIAREKRADAGPPFRISSDGTVF
jgi:hypothetical protein